MTRKLEVHQRCSFNQTTLTKSCKGNSDMPSTAIAENKVAFHCRLSNEAQMVRNALIIT